MATTMTTLARYEGDIPTWVQRLLIDEMERAVRRAEDADRTVTRIAAELGYERVRVNDVELGDRLVFWQRHVRGDRVVTGIDQVVYDPPGEARFRVSLASASHGNVVEWFDDGEFVSRLIPDTQEAF